jgi:hypothetical protein
LIVIGLLSLISRYPDGSRIYALGDKGSADCVLHFESPTVVRTTLKPAALDDQVPAHGIAPGERFAGRNRGSRIACDPRLTIRKCFQASCLDLGSKARTFRSDKRIVTSSSQIKHSDVEPVLNSCGDDSLVGLGGRIDLELAFQVRDYLLGFILRRLCGRALLCWKGLGFGFFLLGMVRQFWKVSGIFLFWGLRNPTEIGSVRGFGLRS